jgi:DNA primase
MLEVKEVNDRINDDLVEIISHYVELKQNGRNYTGSCPFHNEKTSSFTVSPQKGIYKCFGCGKGGDAVKFIMEHEHVEYREAITIGAKKLNLDFEWKEVRDFNDVEYKHKESLRIVCAKAATYFQECITNNLVASNYLKERNFETSADDPFMIGYAPKGNTLMKWAEEQGLNRQLLIESGLVGLNQDQNQYYDFFRERIMFPICDKTGKVIGFTGRSLLNKKEISKYLNSPDTDIFNKGRELFGLNVARQTIRNENRAYLVEGNFDVKRMHVIGVTGTIAPCGTALTVEQARLLKTYTKNVTLIYDGDEAGRKAISRNAEILIKEQFNVSVILIPDGQDPDTLFTSIETFDEYKDKHQQDYIIYKVESGSERCKNPAYKSDFIKEVAALITCYDEPSLHEVYLEAVGQIIKPKKAWQDQIKNIVAEKAPVEQKSIIPKTVSASEFQEFGFYASNNCYYFADNKGVPKLHSNFVLTPLFHIESTINAKRLYEVKNVNNQVRVIEIPQRDLVSLTSFMVHVESLGNFWFDGSQSDLNRLKRWLYEKTESCKEITQLGWQKEGFWAWGNGIFNSEYIPVDSYGIVKHGKKSYYIPAFSQIYEKEENLYQWERKFIHMEGNITLKEYSRKFITVFGENARIALCFYFAAIFRDIVVRRFGIFPILNMFGPKGAGKTACAESIVQFFGRLAKAPNVHNTSKPALADHIATSVNGIAHIDEYRNDIEMEKREFLKGLWDGNGRSRMNMDKDKKREMTSVDQAVILTGQQMATADIALFSRFVFLSFTQVEYSDDERNAFIALKEIEKRGLTHITHQILKLRGIFHDNFVKTTETITRRMREMQGYEVVEDRIFNNWMIPLAAYFTLEDHLELPWNGDELLRMAVKLMKAQNSETKKNDDLGNFWKVVQYLISSNLLYEDGDYKLVITNKLTRRYLQKGEWMKEEYQYDEDIPFLYLTTSRVFSLYKSQCLREGDKPLPESTVEYYLKNSAAFEFETKKESFKKIDPKTGFQEQDDAGNKKRTSTTALVFNNKKLGMNIGPGGNDDDGEMAAKSNGPPPEAVQNDLPF